MPDALRGVFVCYSRQDARIVSHITALLRIAGDEVFRDVDNIPPGKKWRLLIEESLGSCKAVVVCWSRVAARSPNVRAEYLTAIAHNIDLVPVLFDNTPLVPELSEYQVLDLRPLLQPSKRNFLWVALWVIAVVASGGLALIFQLGAVRDSKEITAEDKQILRMIHDHIMQHGPST